MEVKTLFSNANPDAGSGSLSGLRGSDQDMAAIVPATGFIASAYPGGMEEISL